MATTKKTTENTENTGVEVVEVQVKKAPLNILDTLLGADVDKIDLPKKKLEIKRLSEIFGAPFYVTVQAVSANKWEELQDMALKIEGKDVDVDTNLLQIFVVLECTLDDTGKQIFKNMDLVKHFGCVTPKDLVKKLLLSGEIMSIYTFVSDLSGFGDKSVSEVKN